MGNRFVDNENCSSGLPAYSSIEEVDAQCWATNTHRQVRCDEVGFVDATDAGFLSFTQVLGPGVSVAAHGGVPVER